MFGLWTVPLKIIMSAKTDAPSSALIYDERVKKLMDRMSALHPQNEDDRTGRTRDWERIIQELEKRIAKQREQKAQRTADFAVVLKRVNANVEEELEARKKLEAEFESEVASLQKVARKTTDEMNNMRNACDSRLVFKLNTIVETLNEDLIHLSGAKELEACPELETIISHEIPRIKEELTNDMALRKDLESKILSQFSMQVDELSALIADERKKREKKEEEILSAVNSTSKGFESSLAKIKGEREKSENEILALIEKVIERLKTEN